MSGKLKFIIVAAMIFGTMRLLGITTADLWQMASAELDQFFHDTRTLAATTEKATVSQTYRQAADLIPQADSNAVGDDAEMQRELHAARKKVLEDRAAALEKHTGEILRGDVDSLRRQVAENSKKAGGEH